MRNTAKVFCANCTRSYKKMSDTSVSRKVWSRFESKRKDGSVIKLRIEDLPIERLNESFDFMKDHYIGEEAFHEAAGIIKSEEALKEYMELMNGLYSHNPCHIVYCRVDDESDAGEIVGLSVLQISKKSDKLEDLLGQLQIQTKEIQQFFGIIKALDDFNRLKAYEIYYDGRGIMVHTGYRGLGIANEFVRLRKIICIEEDIPVTSAWMTAIGTQKAAQKYGWKTLGEISAEELEKRSGLKFGTKTPMFKLMYTTND